MATVLVSGGGASVLFAILLIFFYLLYEILPLFGGASMSQLENLQWPVSNSHITYMAMEEQGEVVFTIDQDWQGRFLLLDGGEIILSQDLTGESGAISAFASEGGGSRLLAFAHTSGEISLYKHEYRLSYPSGTRHITPRLERQYPGLEISLGQKMSQLAISDSEDSLVIAGVSLAGQVLVTRYEKTIDFLSDELRFDAEVLELPALSSAVAAVYIESGQRWIYLLDKQGGYRVVDLQRVDNNGSNIIADSGRLFEARGDLSSSAMLLGGISLLSASSSGELVQHFMVRTESGNKLQSIRNFDTGGKVIGQLLPEHRRKGFLALSHTGELQIFHTTAHREVLRQEVGASFIATISPRGNKLLVGNEKGQLREWHIDNEHPDISWKALWDKVWYESYDQPEYIWQSSASNNDFEPKFSFSPLAFGTLKAAFYAMLVATPLAICGAIYTAYFMAPALRRKVKPLIELMEALPTVILGFLAGLWLAPFIEDKLTSVFSIMLVMPVGILAFAFFWSRLPMGVRTAVPDGWHAALLVPVICCLAYLCFYLNDPLELWLFGGDMRVWITSELGISFDQRNALVVGIAMGMAVIPTIFSIAEDAIFSVPKHLSYGSLALGATPWQTLVGVVLPTASPGIFSGLMIGMGRAVGETMIVLMATGNTPIMDANIFEGMRTLAANIAVEVPEAEVGSSHYRVLFLAAFVLFSFTFVVNTAAELIRQRLRVKYGSL